MEHGTNQQTTQASKHPAGQCNKFSSQISSSRASNDRVTDIHLTWINLTAKCKRHVELGFVQRHSSLAACSMVLLRGPSAHGFDGSGFGAYTVLWGALRFVGVFRIPNAVTMCPVGCCAGGWHLRGRRCAVPGALSPCKLWWLGTGWRHLHRTKPQM